MGKEFCLPPPDRYQRAYRSSLTVLANTDSTNDDARGIKHDWTLVSLILRGLRSGATCQEADHAQIARNIHSSSEHSMGVISGVCWQFGIFVEVH